MTVPHDARFTFKHEVKQGRSGIISGEKSTIGKVTFNPGATCRHDDSCYVGFRLPSRRKFVPNFLYFICIINHATQGDLTQIFPTFPNPIVNLDFHMKTDTGLSWVSNNM